MTQAEAINLETLIDNHGIQEVMDAIANICWEKSEHIVQSYGDKPLAKLWETNGKRIARMKLLPTG